MNWTTVPGRTDKREEILRDRLKEAETQQVRLAARSLLHRLKEETPPIQVQDWYRDYQTAAKKA